MTTKNIEFRVASKEETKELLTKSTRKPKEDSEFLKAMKALEPEESLRITIPLKDRPASQTENEFRHRFQSNLRLICQYHDIPVKTKIIGNLLVIIKVAYHN